MQPSGKNEAEFPADASDEQGRRKQEGKARALLPGPTPHLRHEEITRQRDQAHSGKNPQAFHRTHKYHFLHACYVTRLLAPATN